MTNNNELQKYKELIDDLHKKLTSLRSTVDAKNVELLNLQTALGQYYAEIEAKEHLERELGSAREESVRLSEQLKVYGALRMTVKMFLMWNSQLLIDVEGDKNVQNSFLEASNLIVLKESSTIHPNANLGVHGQGLLNLSGNGDCIEAQRLILSLFYRVNRRNKHWSLTIFLATKSLQEMSSMKKELTKAEVW